MVERFSPGARQVIEAATEEARSLAHGYVGTEHMLLGLMKSDDRAVARVLESLGLRASRIHMEVLRLVGAGDEAAAGEMPFTPRAKAALEFAFHMSRAAEAEQIGPGHLLIGIAGEGQGVGARILREADADVERIRAELSKAG